MNWKQIIKNSHLFDGKLNSLITLVVVVTFAPLLYFFLNWMVLDATWVGGAESCREGVGFCWSFIKHKMTYILFGIYPRELLWRPILSFIIFFYAIFLIKEPKNWNLRRAGYALFFLFSIYFLLLGGVFGLEKVSSDKLGGLVLTFVVSVVGIVVAYPLGVVLALCRRSTMPVVKYLSVGYIEFIRGIPLISLLFMSSVLLPLFLPSGVEMDKLLRAQIAMVMFFAAYMAEVVRGGLQSISKGQYEGASSLGLNYFQIMSYIILPQALKRVIPPTVNNIIGFFKDTSLLVIIALFDLMYTAKTAATDPHWIGFNIEAYVFVGFVYFVLCFLMSKYSRKIEDHLSIKPV